MGNVDEKNFVYFESCDEANKMDGLLIYEYIYVYVNTHIYVY